MNRRDLRNPYPFHNMPASAGHARPPVPPKAPFDWSALAFGLAVLAIVAVVVRNVL